MADLSYTEIYAKTESELNAIQHDNLMGEEFVDLQSISAKRAAIYLVRETRKNL